MPGESNSVWIAIARNDGEMQMGEGEEEQIYNKGRGCEMMMEVGLIRVGGWFDLDVAKS
jgi:hypothetical protein